MPTRRKKLNLRSEKYTYATCLPFPPKPLLPSLHAICAFVLSYIYIHTHTRTIAWEWHNVMLRIGNLVDKKYQRSGSPAIIDKDPLVSLADHIHPFFFSKHFVFCGFCSVRVFVRLIVASREGILTTLFTLHTLHRRPLEQKPRTNFDWR
ncbi:hypothetical protein F5B17DRAFT_420951 [Nemania serpens]|nr:hypothetical protein F5B17DRAFT_420951 [Nemania serpens]